jgi:Ser/Thr protein kinase RdoA (MazF antagonist)
MAPREIETVLEAYGLGPRSVRLRALKATHRAYHVRAADAAFALRQFNPYMERGHLAAQLTLADLLQETDVRTPPAVPARDGRRFVEVGGRLWAMFPWCEGRRGRKDRAADRLRLAVAAGEWIRAVTHAPPDPRWPDVMAAAGALRQRKDWAWVVPLDRVPAFARQIGALERMRCQPAGAAARRLRPAADDVEACLGEFAEAALVRGLGDLPCAVTHGDLFPANMLIAPGDKAVLLDLDCFCHEPRAADFARAVCRLWDFGAAAEFDALREAFQGAAELPSEEMASVPLLMAGYYLYYAVVHGLLYLVDDPQQRPSILGRIARETAACRRALRGTLPS